MTDAPLSPVLEMAVALLAKGLTIPAFLCEAVPKRVTDIDGVRLGLGMIDGNGGTIKVDRSGTVVCLAYDVGGQLVTSITTGMPCPVKFGARCRVGPMAFGKAGVPHE